MQDSPTFVLVLVFWIPIASVFVLVPRGMVKKLWNNNNVTPFHALVSVLRVDGGRTLRQ